jgi:hypothetical protein
MKMKIFAVLAIAMFITSNVYAIGGPPAENNAATATATSGTTSSQDQGQSQATVLDNVANPSQTTNLDMFNDSFNSEGKRGFAIPGDVSFAPLVGAYHAPTQSAAMQDVNQLVLYNCWFTEGSLESILTKVEKAKAEFKVATDRLEDAPVAEDGTTRWIKIIVTIQKDKMGKVNGAELKGYVNAWSENKNTTMVEVMAKGALAALQNGCNVYHIIAQGTTRDAIATGWGIGFNTTQAQIYGGGEDRSNVTSGGFGYSHAEAGTRDKPWLQGYGLIVADIAYPALKEVPAEK